MKKITIALAAIALIAGAFSCNESSTQSATAVDSAAAKSNLPAGEAADSLKKIEAYATDCSGEDNFIIEEQEGKDMIKNFAAKYNISGLTKAIWVDKEVILAFAQYLYTDEKYDGVRFFNALTGSNRSTIIMIPTRKITGCMPAKGYNCHEEIYEDVFTRPEGPLEFENFGFTKDKVEGMVNGFNSVFRKTQAEEPRDSLSASVWIKKCVFQEMKELIMTPTNNIDGFYLDLAAYMEMGKVTSQQFVNQSTIILVPTEQFGGFHVRNWKLIKSSSYYQGKIKSIDKAYNHGELCPNFCPGQ